MQSFYAKPRLFIAIGLIVVVYILVFIFSGSIWTGHASIGFAVFLVLLDIRLLSKASPLVESQRIVRDKLSLSDNQFVHYIVSNKSARDLKVTLIDELPYQLQQRNFLYRMVIKSGDQIKKKYKVRPIRRGTYQFGRLHLYLSTRSLSFIEKRVSFNLEKEVQVYPSYVQMKKFDLQIFNKVATLTGIKHIRKIGKTDEFEHIKNYTQGDNIKSINWKATSRRNDIMINQHQDTRSQSVYCIVDKGRSMKMPFDQLSLLDYSINSTLVLSNIILKKYDRAGLITFNDALDKLMIADNKTGQLSLISHALYNISTGYKESNFEALYYHIRKKITRRSVLILFSNFEQSYDMRRALPYLRHLNKQHLLVVIFFTNTELLSESERDVEKLSDIYSITFAKKALIEKDLIAEELSIHGIQVILSTPGELSVNVINKYLEIKAKRMV